MNGWMIIPAIVSAGAISYVSYHAWIGMQCNRVFQQRLEKWK